MTLATRPPLSVMFATIRGWPAAKPTVDSLRDQVAAVGGEIVVMDGSANPPPSLADAGAIELFDTATVRRDDETLVNDDRIRIIHHQSMGLMGTAAAEFHNGRTIAGFRRRMLERGDLLRIFGFPVLAIYRSIRSIRIGM